MAVINNDKLFEEIKENLTVFKGVKMSPSISGAFEKDFSLRFCWSSNAIEGNTLSLDDTVAVIEYDEVRSGHTYEEYHDAKSLYAAIKKCMLPFEKKDITEEWIKEAHRILKSTEEGYRTGEVYIGSLAEAVFYPPKPEAIPGLMKKFFSNIDITVKDISQCITEIAEQHVAFERIHPFSDGNGRVGRMILNQQLINSNMLPVAIQPSGKYRQAFRVYDRSSDVSLLVHEICKAEMDAIKRMGALNKKFLDRDRQSSPEIKL